MKKNYKRKKAYKNFKIKKKLKKTISVVILQIYVSANCSSNSSSRLFEKQQFKKI